MRILSCEKGPSGTVSVVPDEGPSFLSSSFWLDRFLPGWGLQYPCEPESLQLASDAWRAEKKAMESLAAGEQSRFLLRRKLEKKGFNPPVLDAVLDRLQERKFLSDERYARSWLRMRLKRTQEGMRLLSQRLSQKGISREISAAVLKEFAEEGSFDALVEDCISVLRRRQSMTREKAYAYAIRKGFSSKEARIIAESFPRG